jgi:hypothetical protein
MKNRLKDGWLARHEIEKLLPSEPTQDPPETPFGFGERSEDSGLSRFDLAQKRLKRNIHLLKTGRY